MLLAIERFSSISKWIGYYIVVPLLAEQCNYAACIISIYYFVYSYFRKYPICYYTDIRLMELRKHAAIAPYTMDSRIGTLDSGSISVVEQNK